MARRFQTGDSIVFPVPAVLNATDAGPRTVLVVGKCTSAYQGLLYTRSSGAHGWWLEIDTTGGLHLNYGQGASTVRNLGAVGSGAAEIWTARKDDGGSVNPLGRRFTGAGFATDGGDVDPGLTLTDGTPIDTSYGIQVGRWGNTGSDYSTDLELYFIAVWNSLQSGATLAGLAKTKAGIVAGTPDYWISFEGSTATDSVSSSPTITGTTVTADPAGFFSSGLTQALPVATETSTAITPGRVKTRALGVAAEGDAAVTFGRVKTRALPVASGTETAVSPGRVKTRAVPTATETDAAVTIGGRITLPLPVAVENSTAQTLTRTKSRALTVATTADLAVAAAAAKRRTLPTAVEADLAVTIGAPTQDVAGVGPRRVLTGPPGRAVATNRTGRATAGSGAGRSTQ